MVAAHLSSSTIECNSVSDMSPYLLSVAVSSAAFASLAAFLALASAARRSERSLEAFNGLVVVGRLRFCNAAFAACCVSLPLSLMASESRPSSSLPCSSTYSSTAWSLPLRRRQLVDRARSSAK